MSHKNLSPDVLEKYTVTMVSYLEGLPAGDWCKITSLAHNPEELDVVEFITTVQSLSNDGYYNREEEYGYISCVIEIKEDSFIRLSPPYIRFLNKNKSC